MQHCAATRDEERRPRILPALVSRHVGAVIQAKMQSCGADEIRLSLVRQMSGAAFLIKSANGILIID